MTKLKYPEWQQQYEAALLEFDPTKLRQLLTAAETAIFVRLLSLSAGPDGQEERRAIADATNALFTIKRDILRLPGHDFNTSKEAQEQSETSSAS